VRGWEINTSEIFSILPKYWKVVNRNYIIAKNPTPKSPKSVSRPHQNASLASPDERNERLLQKNTGGPFAVIA
jgi:hypothetical protein